MCTHVFVSFMNLLNKTCFTPLWMVYVNLCTMLCKTICRIVLDGTLVFNVWLCLHEIKGFLNMLFLHVLFYCIKTPPSYMSSLHNESQRYKCLWKKDIRKNLLSFWLFRMLMFYFTSFFPLFFCIYLTSSFHPRIFVLCHNYWV